MIQWCALLLETAAYAALLSALLDGDVEILSQDLRDVLVDVPCALLLLLRVGIVLGCALVKILEQNRQEYVQKNLVREKHEWDPVGGGFRVANCSVMIEVDKGLAFVEKNEENRDEGV